MSLMQQGFYISGADRNIEGYTHWASGDVYPTIRNGWTFGFQPGSYRSYRENAETDDRFLTSTWCRGGEEVTLRIDLQQAGEHAVHIACGRTGTGNHRTNFRLLDGDDQFATSYAIQSSGNYCDATGVVHGSVSEWIANELPIVHNFMSDYLQIRVIGVSGNSVVTMFTNCKIVSLSAAFTPSRRRRELLTFGRGSL
jgi:hypothetical protein